MSMKRYKYTFLQIGVGIILIGSILGLISLIMVQMFDWRFVIFVVSILFLVIILLNLKKIVYGK